MTMDFEEEFAIENNYTDNRVSCHFCGRKFASESIDRHLQICQKTSKKRPVFNSSKQRDVVASTGVKKTQQSYSNPKSDFPQAKKSTWKQKHEDFLNTVRSAREVTVAIKEGRKPPPMKPSAPNPDYIQCPHCNRRFSESAAERHVTFCAEQHKRLATKKGSSSGVAAQAAARASARISYRPPSLKPSAGPKRSDLSEATRSAPARTTRTRKTQSPGTKFNQSTFGSSQYGSPSFVNESPSPSSRVRKPATPDWDSTVESSVYNPAPRSKTGLKPVSGGNDKENDLSRIKNFHSQAKLPKTMTRKVAGKVDRYSSSQRTNSAHKKQMHERSSESEDNDDGYSYKPAAYQSLHQNLPSHHSSSRRQMTPTSDKTSTQNGLRKVKSQTRHSPHLHSPISNGGQSYDWLQSKSPQQVYDEHLSPVTGSRFCHECGTRYPVSQAKFCCECGIKRILLS